MKLRGHRGDLVLVPVMVAWVVFVAAGTVAIVRAGSPLILASWIFALAGITATIGGVAMLRLANELKLNLSIPAIRVHRGHEPEPEPEPADLPFSDDEYAQMRKRVPFVGLVRSGYTDTSEVMSDNPRPEIAGTIENVTVTGSVATRPVATRPPPTGPDSTTEHRQKA